MGDNINQFAPGYHPGKWASGLVSDSNVAALAAKQLKMAGVPVGDKVSAHFPWLRYVREHLLAGEQSIVKRQQWDDTFANNTARPVLVTEVRTYLGNQYEARDSSRIFDGTVGGVGITAPPHALSLLQKSLWLKLSISGRKDILQKWVPYPLINTVDDFNMATEIDRLAFPLPAPYFLSRSNPFVVDVANNQAVSGSGLVEGQTAFFITLHGWGAKDGQPIDLVQRVPMIAFADYNPSMFQSVVFNEDRDMPMRDAWITHIGIGAGYRDNSVVTGALGWILQNAQIRLQAPEGPSWHSGEFMPVALLAEQISAVWVTDPGTIVVCPAGARHIPITPYVLFPGEQLTVELWNRTDMFALLPAAPAGAVATTLLVDVGVIGIQEKL